MTISNDGDLEHLRDIGGIVARVLAAMGRVPTWYEPADRRTIHDGMVFTIEPFLSTGAEWVDTAGGGWALVAGGGALTVQYEHTVVATKRGPVIVTTAA